MLFNSVEFFLFFLVVYSVYLLLSHRWQNVMLVIASCIFYAGWNWKFLPLMFLSITTDYICSNKIYQSSNKTARKKFLFLSIFVNLSILGFFKYFNFFIDSFQAAALWLFPALPPAVTHSFHIILPVGISFYTFEAISYTVDVYRGIIPPARRYWDYVLFVIYFPHLVAGPIMRAKQFLPQITVPRIITLEKFYEGCFLVFWGLFEKMYVADNLAKIVNPVFADSSGYEGGRVLLALYAFAFQIFCDFDAYSNIARGLGKCMGFEITINFNLPYFSTNPVEFWRRWHISLSSWLRDYLYIPLGGNRGGQWKTCRNLLITMFLGGLWHGAAWTFVLWGMYHGALLIGHRLSSDEKETSRNEQGIAFVLKIILFFHAVVLGWLLFRAQSMSQAGQMLQALFFNFKIEHQDPAMWLKFLGFVAPLWLVQIGQFKSNDLMFLYKQHWLLKTAVYALMAYLLVGWGVMKAEEFIYFQF
jgi:alginate O-acetyltransferase complex protein AlgI